MSSRVMVVRPGPHFSVQDVSRGWTSALRQLGCRVGDFNMDDRLDFYDKTLSHMVGEHEFLDVMRLVSKQIEAACYEFWPDIVFIVSGFFTPGELLAVMQNRGHKLVLLATESPYEDDNQLNLAPFCDLVLLNDPTNIHLYEELAETIYVPHAYDPAVHFKQQNIDPEWVSEFCFVGTGYPSRVDFFEQVDWSGIDAAFAGNWQKVEEGSPLKPFLAHDQRFCLENTDAVDLYSATKASANVYRTEALRPELSKGWAMGPREVELAATGTFYLTEERGENREVLPMIPTFDGPGDFGDKLRWWLAHDKEREQVAEKAQAAIEDRTFINHARQVLERLI